MSSLFKSTVIKGTKMTDFSSTAAEIGIPLPFGYGRVPVPGNVIFAPMPPVEHRQVKRQGKGGVKQETFTYTLSYAVAFLQGPAFGYWWIKRNGKIVYTQDPNAPVEDRDYAAKWAQRVNFYNGTMDQMPDSVIESYEGAGNVSAFRKLVYFSVEDEDVTDNGGAPPNYEACIIASPPEAYLTSHPFPVHAVDGVEVSIEPTGGELRRLLYETFPVDGVGVELTPMAGELKDVYVKRFFYEGVGVELTPTGGQLKNAFQMTDPQKGAVSVELTPTGGQLKAALITSAPQKGAVSVELTPTGGRLQ